MTCEQLVAYLSDYIDHELNDDLTRDASEHLATCQNCRIVLHSTRGVIELGREHGQRAIPAAERAALFTRLQAAFLGQAPGNTR